MGGAVVVEVAFSIFGRFSSIEKDDVDGIVLAAKEFVVDCGT